jgi:hypothetical protein
MRSAPALIVSTLTAAALALAPAAASAAWLAPTPLGQLDTYSFEPAVAAAPDGSVTALWPRIADGRITYVSAARPAGGAWTAPHTLDAQVSGSSALDVVAGPDGTTTAAWIASVGANQAIRTATRAPGGAWSAPQSISDDVRSSEQIDLAAGPDGTVAAIWRRYDSSRWIVQARVRPAGGTWGPVADLSATGQDANGPRIALDGQGTAHAIWSRSNGSRTIAQVSAKPAGGGWSAAQSLSGPGFNAGNTQIAVSPAGDAVVAWTRGTTPTSAQAATRPAGGAWSTIHDLSVAGRTAAEPQVGIDAAGNATVLWGEEDGVWRVRAATRPAGGAWSAATTISDTSRSAFAPTLAVQPDGAAVAGWFGNEGSTSRIEAAHRAGGAWTAPAPVSASGRVALHPQLALDGRGNAVMVWERATDGDATKHEIQAAGFDGEAPTVGAIDGPATATAGVPVAFSAQASDVWSPVQLAWAFGDGATAGGPSAAHVFATPGERQVTVTATDATGRATSASRTVAVSAAPLPIPPGGDDSGRGGEQPAVARATVGVVRQRLGVIARQKSLRATCRLTAAGRCTVTATIPARTARALGLKVKRKARTYTLGAKTVRIAKPGARATAAIALDRRESAALARARTLKVTVTATAGAAKATATAALRR